MWSARFEGEDEYTFHAGPVLFQVRPCARLQRTSSQDSQETSAAIAPLVRSPFARFLFFCCLPCPLCIFHSCYATMPSLILPSPAAAARRLQTPAQQGCRGSSRAARCRRRPAPRGRRGGHARRQRAGPGRRRGGPPPCRVAAAGAATG